MAHGPGNAPRPRRGALGGCGKRCAVPGVRRAGRQAGCRGAAACQRMARLHEDHARGVGVEQVGAAPGPGQRRQRGGQQRRRSLGEVLGHHQLLGGCRQSNNHTHTVNLQSAVPGQGGGQRAVRHARRPQGAGRARAARAAGQSPAAYRCEPSAQAPLRPWARHKGDPWGGAVPQRGWGTHPAGLGAMP